MNEQELRGTVPKPGDPKPHTLAVGDRVRDADGNEGAITDNDGTGFTVTWDKGGEEYHDHYDDGAGEELRAVLAKRPYESARLVRVDDEMKRRVEGRG